MLSSSPSEESGPDLVVAMNIPPFPFISPIFVLVMGSISALLPFPSWTGLCLSLTCGLHCLCHLLLLFQLGGDVCIWVIVCHFGCLLFNLSTFRGTFCIISVETCVFFLQVLVWHLLLSAKCGYLFLVIMMLCWLGELRKHLIFWMVIVAVEWVDCLFLGKFYKNPISWLMYFQHECTGITSIGIKKKNILTNFINILIIKFQKGLKNHNNDLGQTVFPHALQWI